jgi:hypothetical protein
VLVTNQTSADLYFGPLHLGAGIGTQLTVDDTSDTSLYLLSDSVADALNNAYNSGKITVSGQAQPFPRPTGEPELLHGDGSPEGIIYAPQGSLYMRRDGTGADSLYVKSTGVTLNTGWLSFGSAVGGAGTEWDYAQITAPVTVDTSSYMDVIVGNTVVYDGTRVKVEAWWPSAYPGASSGSGNHIYMYAALFRDSTELGSAQATGESTGTGYQLQTYLSIFDTPPAGSHTYSLKAYGAFSYVSQYPTISAGVGGSDNNPAAFLRVTKA